MNAITSTHVLTGRTPRFTVTTVTFSRRVLGLAAVALLTCVGPRIARACEEPLTLSARSEGEHVRFAWSGRLAGGERFVLYNFALEALSTGAPAVIGTAVYSGSDSEFLHELVEEPGYTLTCEDAAGMISATSNMAFRLPYTFSRTFDLSDFDELNFERYPLSLPLLSGMAEVGGGSTEVPCEGVPDAVFTPDDILCEFWDPDAIDGGVFSVEVPDSATDSWLARTGFKEAGGSPKVLGSVLDLGSPDRRGEAVIVRLEGNVAEFSGFLTGAHDPSFVGMPLRSGPDEDGIHYLSVPYHTKYRSGVEVACGLEGVDWTDADADGWPDTCDGGIYSEGTGGMLQGCRLDILKRPSREPGSDGTWLNLTVSELFGELQFSGDDWALVPGEALVVHRSADCEDALFLSPHY